MEELSGERFSYCPGLPAYAGDRMIRLTDADLKRILLEKYNGTVVLRARDCTRLRDREHAKGSAGLKRHTLRVFNCFADLDFFGPKWHSLRSLPFKGPKKSRLPGPPLLTALVMDFPPSKSII